MDRFVVTLNNTLTLNDILNPNGWNLDRQQPIVGLGMSDIRTSQGLFSGRQGGYVSQQFLGVRPITINGTFFATDVSQVAAARRTITNVIDNIGASWPLTITTFDGNTYYMDVYTVKFDMDYDEIKQRAVFKLELVAPDPYIYDISSGSALTATVNLYKEGGYPTPYTLPVTWDPGTSPTVINNSGAVNVYPVITLTGKMTNPSIVNNTSGKTLQLSPLTTSTGDVVVIDMKNKTITLNGGNILALKTTASQWWSLLTGNNIISLLSTDASDTVVATVTWRNAYTGI